jgi:SAM-dependent methyltransferase
MTADAISLAVADFLLSPRGRAAADALRWADLSSEQTLPLLTTLRRDFSAAEAGALLALVRLRQRALAKFPFAEQLFLTSEALEQATAWPVAEHRAAWFDQWTPPGALLDLGCGIGGDTLALAQHRPILAFESDPLRLRFAQANAASLGLAEQITFFHADWTSWLALGKLPPVAGAFADPGRRVADKRVFHLHRMEPPLARLLELQRQIPALGAKVMPGVQDEELPLGCGVEFVSHAGVCKEAVLWFGSLAQHRRWASVHTATGWQSLVSSGLAAAVGPLQPALFLHEPDPAVIRAGALPELCERLGAYLFDLQIAYLIAPAYRPDPFVQSFWVKEIHPFSLQLLNQRLLALGIGQVELKKRGFPVEPETLRPRLKLAPGHTPGVVIFTRRGGQRLMLIGERVQKSTHQRSLGLRR